MLQYQLCFKICPVSKDYKLDKSILPVRLARKCRWRWVVSISSTPSPVCLLCSSNHHIKCHPDYQGLLTLYCCWMQVQRQGKNKNPSYLSDKERDANDYNHQGVVVHNIQDLVQTRLQIAIVHREREEKKRTAK